MLLLFKQTDQTKNTLNFETTILEGFKQDIYIVWTVNDQKIDHHKLLLVTNCDGILDKSSIGKIDFFVGLEKELYLPGQAKLRKSVKTAGSHRLLKWKKLPLGKYKKYFSRRIKGILR